MTYDKGVTRRAVGMTEGALGWINANFFSISLFGNPALTGRVSIVMKMLTDTANLNDRNVRGHLRSSFGYMIVLVMTLLTMRFEIPDEFTSTKQYGFALLFGEALIVRSKFAHPIKRTYQLPDQSR